MSLLLKGKHTKKLGNNGICREQPQAFPGRLSCLQCLVYCDFCLTNRKLLIKIYYMKSTFHFLSTGHFRNAAWRHHGWTTFWFESGREIATSVS